MAGRGWRSGQMAPGQRFIPNLAAIYSAQFMTGPVAMHPFPRGYHKVVDGDLIQVGDLALGKVTSACGQGSYGWANVAPHLIGQEYFEGALELGHPMMLIRKDEEK